MCLHHFLLATTVTSPPSWAVTLEVSFSFGMEPWLQPSALLPAKAKVRKYNLGTGTAWSSLCSFP